MPNYISPMANRVFLQAQPSQTQISNTAGVWNPAGAQFVAIENNALTLTPDETKVPLNFIHGTPDMLGSIQGRKGGSWALTCPVFPSGTQAVAPDIDLLLQGTMGGPGGLVTNSPFGNAWNYGFYSFQTVPLTILSFSHSSPTVGSRYGVGCVVGKTTINMNGDILGLQSSGPCLGVGEQEVFNILDPDVQAGLTSYPLEPSTFASKGSATHGYGGRLFFGIAGTTYTLAHQVNQFSLEITTGISLDNNFVDSLYSVATLYGSRSVGVSFGCYNTDDSALTVLKQAARNNTKVAFYYQLNPGVVGRQMYINIAGVQITPAQIQDGNDKVQLNFGTAFASATPGTADEFNMGFA